METLPEYDNGTVNSPVRETELNVVEKQVATAESNASLRSSLAKICSIRSIVIGFLLGHLEEGGARVAALVKAAFTSALFMDHVVPCRRCHALTAKT